jgi:hypothetical protein
MNLRALGLAVSVFGVAVLLGMALYSWVTPETGALAELRQIQGDAVERDFSQEVGKWSHARAGALFGAGDGMRTLVNTSAILALADQSELRVSPNTTLRFLLQNHGEQEILGIDVESGEAVIQVGRSDLALRTHIGRATLVAGSLVSLTREGEGIDFAVKVGRLSFEDEQGKTHVLKPGDHMRLGIGMAELTEQASEPTDKGGRISLAVSGPGTRVRRQGGDAFEELAQGEHALSAGSELKLGKGARAVLSRGQDRAELRGEGAYVVGGDDVLLEAQRGDATLESNERDVAVRVPGGVIIVRSQDGRARVQLSARDGALEVLDGKVSTNIGGESEELSAGDLRSWAIEGAHDSASGEDGGFAPEPDYFNMSVPAGESFVLHAPELPVSAALDVGTRCPGEAEIELVGAGQKTRGSARIKVLLSARTRAYNVRCVSDKGTAGRVVAKGTLRVLLDAGTRKLPPTPPSSLADADGRTYTVYYSNQAPAVRLRWPNAPSSASYTLIVDGREQAVAQPEHVFGSGDLRDGVHQVAFRAGTRGSRTTFIDVRFDNNAPTASVEAPANRGFASGQPVQVAGVSLPAWKVSLEGGSVERDANGRFAGSIVPNAEHPDVVVRLSHPHLGVHYYLRRAGSSP